MFDFIKQWLNKLALKLGANPYKTVLIAFGGGFIVGALVF